MKTETNYQTVKREFNTQLETAVKANGGINIATDADEPIGALLLTSLKGVYGVEYGEMELNFEFMGSKAACYKYLHKQEIENKKKVATLLSNHIDRVEKGEALINDVAMLEVHVR